MLRTVQVRAGTVQEMAGRRFWRSLRARLDLCLSRVEILQIKTTESFGVRLFRLNMLAVLAAWCSSLL